MLSVIDYYKSLNSSLKLFLEAESDNSEGSLSQPKLIKFYEKFGFSVWKQNSHYTDMFFN